MTPQEESMLNDLVQKVNSTRVQDKDSDAERLLRDGLSRNPDSIYVLAQTVLVQNIALDQARQQMTALQQQPQSKPTSFLGSLFGHHDPQPQGAPPTQGYRPVQYAPPPTQQYAPPQAYGAAPVGQPSFLRSAATTAAGVAAGALAFEGVESLLHGGGGFGGEGFGGGYGGAPREEIINNYYGDSGSNGGDAFAGPNEQPQGDFGGGGQDAGYGDDFTDGGGDFGGDDFS